MNISNVHKEGCSLKWNPPEDDGGSPIDHYEVEKMDADTGITSAGFQYLILLHHSIVTNNYLKFFMAGRWVPAGTCTGPKIDLENLVPEKEYKFRVMAVNAEGNSEPLEAEQSIIAKSKYGNTHTIN